VGECLLPLNCPRISQETNAMNLKVSKVIALMSGDAHRAHTLAELAAYVNLSTSRLRHLFKEETGVTLSEYVKLLRLRRAAELLATTFLSVKEVMTETGLKSQSHFVRVFKRAYGLTPTRYRAMYHGATDRPAEGARAPLAAPEH
jgi:transcriptional regulator GlxA family with amidase domain